MRKRIWPAVLVAAAIAASALAAAAETGDSVTILRGGATMPRDNTAGSGSSTNPAAAPNNRNVIDQSGDLNALHTGSANAGGVIANPPPAAGR